ncbi:MAG: GerAB/ArcD/ProY family transporter [Thermacetogeniaceae bacterium]
MGLEKGKIASSGLMMLMVGFIFGSSLILTPGRGAEHDAWIAVLLGSAEGLLLAWLYTILANRFPGKTLVEVVEMVYGRYLGKIISAAFLGYLLHLGALVLANFITYLSSLIMCCKTPKVVFPLLIILVCVSAACKGVEVITRCSEVLVPPVFILIVLDTILLAGNMKLKYLLPVMETPLPRLLFTAYSVASFPFAETVAFLMLLAFLNKEQEAFPSAARAIIFSGLVMAVVVARNSAVLGPTEKAFIFPSFQAIMLIDIAEITRMEALVSFIIVTMGFLKITTLLYATALGTAQIFKLKSYQPIVLPTGILMVIIGLYSSPSTIEMLQFAEKIYPIYALPFQVGIPLFTLFLAWLRKLPKEEA